VGGKIRILVIRGARYLVLWYIREYCGKIRILVIRGARYLVLWYIREYCGKIRILVIRGARYLVLWYIREYCGKIRILAIRRVRYLNYIFIHVFQYYLPKLTIESNTNHTMTRSKQVAHRSMSRMDVNHPRYKPGTPLRFTQKATGSDIIAPVMTRSKFKSKYKDEINITPENLSSALAILLGDLEVHSHPIVPKDVFLEYRAYQQEGSQNPLMLGILRRERFTTSIMCAIMTDYNDLVRLYC